MNSIEGLATTQPPLEEFEHLIALQESLAVQMAGVKIHDDSESVFVARRQQNFKSKHKDGDSRNNDGISMGDKKRFKCYWCRKLGHLKRIDESN